jgi:hypothetical protein
MAQLREVKERGDARINTGWGTGIMMTSAVRAKTIRVKSAGKIKYLSSRRNCGAKFIGNRVRV